MIVGYMFAVGVDEVNGFVYWSDIHPDVLRVKQARFDGSNQADVYSKLNCVTYQMV